MKSSTQTFQEAAARPPASSWTACAERLQAAGFDLVQPLAVGSAKERSPLWHEPWATALLPSWAQREAVHGLLIGNTRQLWEPFLEALRGDPALATHRHPLDAYTVSQVESAVLPLRADTDPPLELWVGYAHTLSPAPLPMTRLADTCGLGRLSPAGLVVHPEYGPWIALRAVVLVRAQTAQIEPPGAHPCQGCAAPCVVQARRARGLAAARTHREPSLPLGPVLPQLSRRARLWLAVRDVCPLGTAHRYSPAQISYHYDKDRGQLPAPEALLPLAPRGVAGKVSKSFETSDELP